MNERIGIDLGSKTIKMAIVQEVSGIFNLKNYKTYDVKENISEKEYYTYLRKCIADFVRTNKLSFVSLNFTIPYDFPSTNIKLVKMPTLNRKILNKSIIYELEEEYDNLNSIYHLWEIVDKDEEREECDILLGVVNQNIINSLSKLKKVKWKVERIELQPISLGRLVKENSVVIDFGHKSTKVYAYKNGNLFNVTNIPIAGEKLNKSIENLLPTLDSVSLDEKKHSSFVWNDLIDYYEKSEEDILISKKITEDIMSLSNEIKIYIRGLELQNNIYFDNIYYLGGTSNLLYLTEIISKELDADIKPIEFLSTNEDDKGYDFLNNYLLASSVSINYKYFETMNFNKFTKKFIDFSSFAVTVLLMAVVINVGSYQIHNKYNSTINDLEELNLERDRIMISLDSRINNARNDISHNKKVVEKIENIDKFKTWLSDILYILPEKTPNTIGIEKMNIKNNLIVINGYSKDYSSIGFFAMELEKLGRVNIDSISDTVPVDVILDETIIEEDIDSEEEQEIIDDNKMTKIFQITLQYENSILEHDLEVIDITNEEEIFEETELEVQESLDENLKSSDSDFIEEQIIESETSSLSVIDGELLTYNDEDDGLEKSNEVVDIQDDKVNLVSNSINRGLKDGHSKS